MWSKQIKNISCKGTKRYFTHTQYERDAVCTVSGLCCLIFGLSVELIGRNPLNMLKIRDKEEGSAMTAEGSVITSEDSAITSEGSAIKNENSVKERENSEGNTCLAD